MAILEKKNSEKKVIFVVFLSSCRIYLKLKSNLSQIMVFRRTYRKRTNFKKKVNNQKPTAWNQKKQISTLASRVNRLYKRTNTLKTYRQLSLTSSGNLSAAYNVESWHKTNLWTKLGAWTTEAKKFYAQKYYFDMLFTCNTEESPVTFSVFTVSLKPGMAKKLIDDAGEELSSLSTGTHYTATNSKLIVLNRDYFNIHKAHRFTIAAREYTADNDEGRNQKATWKRISYWVKFPRQYKTSGDNWSNLYLQDQPGFSRLYTLIFNDNSSIDLEYPFFEGTMLINGYEV